MAKILFINVRAFVRLNGNDVEYNTDMIQFVSESNFDKVYLISDYQAGDIWMDILRGGGQQIPPNWRDLLLSNVIQKLESNGIHIKALSMWYDFYFCDIYSKLPETFQTSPVTCDDSTTTIDDLSSSEGSMPGDIDSSSDTLSMDEELDTEGVANYVVEALFPIEKAGDAANAFYLGFEKALSELPDDAVKADWIFENFETMTGGKEYPCPYDASNKTALIAALPLYFRKHPNLPINQLKLLLWDTLKEEFDNGSKEGSHLYFIDTDSVIIEKFADLVDIVSESYLQSKHGYWVRAFGPILDSFKDAVQTPIVRQTPTLMSGTFFSRASTPEDTESISSIDSMGLCELGTLPNAIL